MKGCREGNIDGVTERGCAGVPRVIPGPGPEAHGSSLQLGRTHAGPCAVRSRVAPAEYVHRDDNVQRELRDWGLSFDSNLLSFSGRILQAEKIHQGGKTVRPFVKLPVLWGSGQTPRK